MYISSQIKSVVADFITQTSAYAPIYQFALYTPVDPTNTIERVERASLGFTQQMLNPMTDSTGTVWSLLCWNRSAGLPERINRGMRGTGLSDPGRVPHRQAPLEYTCPVQIPVTCIFHSNRANVVELMEEFLLTQLGVKGWSVTNLDDPKDPIGYFISDIGSLDYSSSIPSISFTLKINGYVVAPVVDQTAMGIDTINTIYHLSGPDLDHDTVVDETIEVQ